MIYSDTFDYYPFRIDGDLLILLVDSVKDRLQHTPRSEWSLALIRSHIIQDLPSNHWTNIRQPWCDAVITVLINDGFLLTAQSALAVAIDKIVANAS